MWFGNTWFDHENLRDDRVEAFATYLYGGKSWQVLVNANTGEVVGDRPWSVPKIVAAVLAGLLLVGIVVAMVMAGRGNG